MDKRLFAIGGLIIAIATSIYACRATGAPGISSATPAPTPVAVPSAPTALSPTSSTPVVPDPMPTVATAPPPAEGTAAKEPAPLVIVAPTGVPSPLPISGVSHQPTTGKPVAAVTVEWDLQPDPSDPGHFTGTIGAINQAGQALVTLSVETIGEVALRSAAQVSAPILGRGERLVLPVIIQLLPGTASAELVVTVRVEAAGVRSRIVSIPIRRPVTPAASEKSSTTPPEDAKGQPLQGEHTLTGSDGQAVHFMPAAGQK